MDKEWMDGLVDEWTDGWMDKWHVFSIPDSVKLIQPGPPLSREINTSR